jgi:hypothetical protein
MTTHQSLAGRFLLCTLVMVVFAVHATPTQAARSTKPKEIVVVGSKVKEVISPHELMISDQAVLTLSQKVVDSLHDAFRRAERNRRYTLLPEDLSCPGQATSEDEFLLDEESLRQRLPAMGFALDPDFFPALNGVVYQLLDTAIARAWANDRNSIEPYDF